MQFTHTQMSVRNVRESGSAGGLSHASLFAGLRGYDQVADCGQVHVDAEQAKHTDSGEY
jgi:hypothetical protein